MVGTTLGVYRIEEEIGRGGMGQVYRARDTTLYRDVAIKVLPDGLTKDPDRLARLEREAQALAALNHPNIANIYGLERSGLSPAIVMEFVGGEDLPVRIKRGPVPLAEALPLARQIADALSAAHEAGIIHRDLKPGNIKVTDDGVGKVLDFGLAKALDPRTTPGTSEAANSPTLTNRATQMGVILGTAAYMAPEQARGKVVDKRADIWAFGVVLFEMLSGRRPFDANDISDVLAYILTKEPDWASLPAATPLLIRRLLERCLTKDPKQRLHDIADARLEIEETARLPQLVGGPVTDVSRWRRWSPALALTLACATLGVGFIAWSVGGRRLFDTAQGLQAQIPISPAEELSSGLVTRSSSTGRLIGAAGGANTALAWSPDGRTLAFVAVANGRRQIYVRDLQSGAARPIDNTTDATSLAFSSDGAWIAFSSGGQIAKVSAGGGPVVKVCDAATVRGINWGDRHIAYAAGRNVFVVSPNGGGSPVPVTSSERELVRHASPHFLPGDTAVLYTEHEKQWSSGDERVMIQPLAEDGTPEGEAKILIADGADARYVATGHLVFIRQGTLMSVPFHLKSREIRGSQLPIQDGVSQGVMAGLNENVTLAGQFAVSARVLAHIASPLPSYFQSELVAVDRSGAVATLNSEARPFGPVLASQDGRRLSTTTRTAKQVRFQVFDLARGSLSSDPAGFASEVTSGVISEDGRVAVLQYDRGTSSLAIGRIDGATPPEVVPDSSGFWPASWSPDGRTLAGTRNGDTWLYSVGASQPSLKALAETEPSESHPDFSHDGRWLAYVSSESAVTEVYLRPYPGPGPRVQVSRGGGTNPAWNPRGGELFYTTARSGDRGDRAMMRVDMANPERPGTPQHLFTFAQEDLGFEATPARGYGVSADGQRFYVRRFLPFSPARVTHINVIFDWVEKLKRR